MFRERALFRRPADTNDVRPTREKLGKFDVMACVFGQLILRVFVTNPR